MNVCLLALRIDSFCYSIAKAVSFGGHSLLLIVLDQEHTCELDSRLSGYLALTPGVRIGCLSDPALPGSIDHLIFQGQAHLCGRGPLAAAVAGHAGKLTVISNGDRNYPYVQALEKQWHELVWYGRYLHRVSRVVYKDGFYPVDLSGIFKPRDVVGFDIHSNFLHHAAAFQKIHAKDWRPDAHRPILANFVGSRDPARRKRIIDSVRPFFLDSACKARSISCPKSLFWHEYSDATPDVLEPAEYLDVLSCSDFTLCPPGYSLVTHRPMEALLRGSIPVLHSNELDLYDLGLRDGTNCIAVLSGQWPNSMERLLRFDEDTIVGMRRKIIDMVDDCLAYATSSKRMRRRLGLQDRPE